MKRYFEILIKTLQIQIFTTAIAVFLYFVPTWYYFCPVIFGWLLSWIAVVYMAFERQEVWYKRLIYIF